MNINLDVQDTPNPTVQDDIDEHIQIMQMSGHHVGQPVMLLSDPEYPGAYRVWTCDRVVPNGQDPTWWWVTPDGEVIRTQRPWAVTD